MFSVVVLILIFTLTTAAITTPIKTYGQVVDDIATCSSPQGEIQAHGIDVSKYQGDVDFKKVKAAGYDFAVLRVGTSQGGKDSNFEAYYKGALEAGLDIGCYYYTYATTAEEARAEALDVLSFIKDKYFSYPVFFDFEYPQLQSYDRIGENTAMINTFCKYIKRGGYYPGVYTSNSIYNNYIDSAVVGNTWDVWIANYRDHSYDYQGFASGFSMWQYSNKGRVDGINADVDLNVCYVDYPSITGEFQRKLKQIQ